MAFAFEESLINTKPFAEHVQDFVCVALLLEMTIEEVRLVGDLALRYLPVEKADSLQQLLSKQIMEILTNLTNLKMSFEEVDIR